MKFLDIITEHQREVPMDNKFNRSVLHMISKKFDIKRLGLELKNVNKSAQLDSLFRMVWPLLPSTEFDSPVSLKLWLERTFSLDETDIGTILYLLYRNTQVDDFLNDSLITNEPFWVTKIYYYVDEVEEITDVDTWDCDKCDGYGYDRESCDNCDGCGNITTDDQTSEECDQCDASGYIESDCRTCGGECEITSETDVAILSRNEMVVTSEEKIVEPRDGEEFTIWFNNNRNKFDIIYDEEHDSEKVDIKHEGEQTKLEEIRGKVDYAIQNKIDDEESIKRFSNWWIV